MIPRFFREARPFLGARRADGHPFLLGPARPGREPFPKLRLDQRVDPAGRQLEEQTPVRQRRENPALRFQRVRSEPPPARSAKSDAVMLRERPVERVGGSVRIDHWARVSERSRGERGNAYRSGARRINRDARDHGPRLSAMALFGR